MHEDQDNDGEEEDDYPAKECLEALGDERPVVVEAGAARGKERDFRADAALTLNRETGVRQLGSPASFDSSRVWRGRARRCWRRAGIGG